MKKLMILASAIVMACTLHAASFTWGFTSDSIKDSTGEYINGGTAFLFLGDVTAGANTFSLLDATFLASAGQNGYPLYNYGSASTPISSDALTSTAAGQKYTLILLEKTNVSSLEDYEGNYILASGISGQGVNPMDDTDTWATFTNPTAYGASDWSTMTKEQDPVVPGPGDNVPEPTSGLLMLVGLAGLALRRKQA
jgi:hypothetical protein